MLVFLIFAPCGLTLLTLLWAGFLAWMLDTLANDRGVPVLHTPAPPLHESAATREQRLADARLATLVQAYPRLLTHRS